jgi:tetratricopeptide (TPR) repeat protein
MQFPNDQPQPCWFCKKRPATVKYTHRSSTLTEMVCATCLDRLEVQEAFEYKFKDIIIPLEENEQYDEALACLDAFLEANRHRDHDQWLARSIASHRANILFDAGRYAEAEHACEAWAELGFDDVWVRWWHRTVTAQTLDALGRSREGLAVLEDALTHQDPKHLPTARGYLEKLAEISEKLGQPVDPKWRTLAQEVAEWYGVEMPKHESLGKAILELAEAIREKERMRRGEGEPSDDDDEP